MKKILYITFFMLNSMIGFSAHAEISYGAKFLFTTAGGCAVGGLTEFAIAKKAGFDSQPTQIVSLLGATSGCLTGALISYFFYEDKTRDYDAQFSAQAKVKHDLSLHLVAMKNHNQTETQIKRRY